MTKQGAVRNGSGGQAEEQTVFVPATQQDSSAKDNLQHTNLSQAGSQGKRPGTCDHCGFTGHFGQHLRLSPGCVQAYKNYPQFKMKADAEEFIVRVCILTKNCPNPECRTGMHRGMPAACLAWWAEGGWKSANWRTSTSPSSGKQIQDRIKDYRKKHFAKVNHRKQGRQPEGSQDDSQISENSSFGRSQQERIRNSVRCRDQLREHGVEGQVTWCVKCSQYKGPLAAHLLRSEDCLKAMVEDHLRGRSVFNPRMSVMDLSLLVKFCPNPDCNSAKINEGPLQHLGGFCGQFIIREACAVYNWHCDGDITQLKGKLTNRASYLKEMSKQREVSRPSMYKKELSSILHNTCMTCRIQVREMAECVETSPTIWQCKKCWKNPREREGIYDAMLTQVGQLAETRHGDEMKAVEIVNGQSSRIVFMPRSLATNLTVQDDHPILDPKRTTILVPYYPDALDLFDEETMDAAVEEKGNLKRVSEFIGKRVFASGAIAKPMTVMLRRKLAEIKEGRLRMIVGMKSTKKGEVINREGKVAKIKGRNPHYDATKFNCLTKCCPWSDGYQQNRAKESFAISCANGQLKTRVKITIVSNLAQDCPELQQIMILLSKRGALNLGLIPIAPIVLQFAKAKIDLIVEHAISEQYRNWDFNVIFKEDEWTVEMEGLLYSAEYDDINKNIAKHGCSNRTIIDAVLRHPEVRPIASLDKQWIADHCGIREEEAGDIAAEARIHQNGGPAQPLSMVLMYTAEGFAVTAEEKFYRQRMIELGLESEGKTSCEDAIMEIMSTLANEGFHMNTNDIDEEVKMVIEDQIPNNDRTDAELMLIVLYHAFLFKTNSSRSWTVPRGPGESTVEAYLPRILQVNRMRVTAETVADGQGLQPHDQGVLRDDIRNHLDDGDLWKEVSVLEYVNAHLSEQNRLLGQRSQTLVQIMTEKDDRVDWRQVRDEDKQNGDDVFINEEEGDEGNGYVRSKGDFRRLYEARPREMRRMTLGQFATQYRVIQRGGCGLESAKGKIDSETDVGPASGCMVSGSKDTAAPQCMRLSNGVIMQMRTKRSAVLRLLYSGLPGRFGHQLLWEPWQYFEQVRGNDDDEETYEQKSIRLSLLPFSVYPKSEEDL